MNSENDKNNTSPYKKPPFYVRIFLCAYAFIWLNMIFIAGVNTMATGKIDYDSFTMFIAMSAGFYVIFKYFPRLY